MAKKKTNKKHKKKTNIKFRRFIGRFIVISILLTLGLVTTMLVYGINIGFNYVYNKIKVPVVVTSVLDVIDNELDTPSIVTAERIVYEIEPTAEPIPATENDITDAVVLEYEDGVVVGESGYYYYKFDESMSEYFTLALNTSISKISSDVNIYTMIVPSAIDIMLPIEFLYEYADYTSDQDKTIDYLNFYTDSNATTIDLYDIFKSHCDEPLYYSSDTNWTSLAAYYAFSEFMYYTGGVANNISSYTNSSEDGFLGNIYTSYIDSEVFTIESIDYYIPSSVLSLKSSNNDVFEDVSNSSSSDKYDLFLGGSDDLITIENSSVTDGSVLVLVSDSLGYTVAPYLADKYQTTYFVDYRYYTDSLSALVDSVEADELLYIIDISTTTDSSAISTID